MPPESDDGGGQPTPAGGSGNAVGSVVSAGLGLAPPSMQQHLLHHHTPHQSTNHTNSISALAAGLVPPPWAHTPYPFQLQPFTVAAAPQSLPPHHPTSSFPIQTQPQPHQHQPPQTHQQPQHPFRQPHTVPTLLVNDGSIVSSSGNPSSIDPVSLRIDDSMSSSSGVMAMVEDGDSISSSASLDQRMGALASNENPTPNKPKPLTRPPAQSAVTLVNPTTKSSASAPTMLFPFRQITDKEVVMSPHGEEEEGLDLDFNQQEEEEASASSSKIRSSRRSSHRPHEPSVTLQHRKTNDPRQLLEHTQNALEKPQNLRKHHSEMPAKAGGDGGYAGVASGAGGGAVKMTLATNAEKSAAAAGATTAGANPTELPSKIKRSQLKPEIIEQLSCLAANVTLRLVGTRWRLVMQQQHLMNQHSQQHLPLNPLQQLPHHSLGFGPSSRTSSTASLSPSTLTPSSPISPYMLSPMNGAAAAAAAMNSHNGMFLTIPQQHLHPLTPPQSPFKHLPTSLHPSPTQPPTPLRTTSTASVSPAESITSTTTLSNNPPLQTPQTNSHGSSPLPATYLFHYAHRLRAMVTHTLSRTRAPAQIVPYALLIVHRLVSLRTLPEPLATPTRLLLASLMLADVVLRDATTPVAAWTAIGKAVGAGIDERKHVAALKIVALEALNWRVVFPPHEFEAWLERLKGWVAGAAAAVGIATTPTSTTSARGGVPTVSPYTVSPLIGSPAASPQVSSNPASTAAAAAAAKYLTTYQNQSGTVMGHVYTPTMRAGSAPYGGGSPYAYHPYQVAFTRQASGGGFHVVSPGVVRTETRGEMVVEATDTL